MGLPIRTSLFRPRFVVTLILLAAVQLSMPAFAQTTPVAVAADKAAPNPSAPAVFATEAKQVLLVEEETGSILFEKNISTPFTAASLAKLMTVEVVLDALKSGKLSLNQEFPVSEYAWRTGGAPSRTATMFAAVRSRVPVEALLKGVMVQMANDACLILAEGMAGSEDNFVKLMNQRAVALGLQDSHFANATGLPNPDNKVSARDMVKLAEHIKKTYPAFYKLYAEPEFEWNHILQRNRNPLLRRVPGVDGLVAGFAEGEGYSIVASAEQNGVRLYLALAGSATDTTREDDAARAFAWGFSAFEKRRLFEAGQTVGKASVYGGEPGEISLQSPQAVDVYVPTDAVNRLTAQVVYHWPLRPPIQAGQEVARLHIMLGDKQLRDLPLKAEEPSKLGPLMKRLRDAVVELLFSWV